MKPRQIADAVQRSRGRARAVETPEHLPDAARDAYVLANEYEALRIEVERLRRFQQDVRRSVREWL